VRVSLSFVLTSVRVSPYLVFDGFTPKLRHIF
jgi:hypothetical protein